MFTDPRMIAEFERQNGDGSYLRFLRNIIVWTTIIVATVIFLGTHGYL